VGCGQLGRGREALPGCEIGIRSVWLDGLRGYHVDRPTETGRMAATRRKKPTGTYLRIFTSPKPDACSLPTHTRRRLYLASSLEGWYTTS
jgi:hypothetical protein